MSKIYRIGRLTFNDICLDSDQVSRTHAEITCMDDGTYLLTDHSKNGTYVNGHKVNNSSMPVHYGDNILFANIIPLDWSRIENPSYSGGTVIDQPIYGPVQSQTTNGMAIAGFVLSFFFALLGLIFSIIGLNKSKEMGGKGRGLALAGIIISAVSMVITILVYCFYWGAVSTLLWI